MTSYAEIALNPRRADQAHPAFAKLFLETEYLLAETAALLCRRRPRARRPATGLGAARPGRRQRQFRQFLGDFQFETDRARFLGRGRSAANPWPWKLQHLFRALVGRAGSRSSAFARRVRLEPGASTVLSFTTAAPEDRDEALGLAGRFSNLRAVDRVFDEAVSAAGATGRAEPHAGRRALFQRLAAHVIFTSPLLRSRVSVAGNRLGQPGLWPHAISGDLPIVLLRIGTESGLELAAADPPRAPVLALGAVWCADLVLLNDAGDDLRRPAGRSRSRVVRRPNSPVSRVACLCATRPALSADDDTLLEAAARVILRDSDGTLTEQLCPPRTREGED